MYYTKNIQICTYVGTSIFLFTNTYKSNIGSHFIPPFLLAQYSNLLTYNR
jgi:hypothetical protein